MKRNRVFGGLLVVAVSMVGIGLLAGCDGSSAAEAQATPLPVAAQEGASTVVAQEGASTVVAEAVIEPARWSALSLEIAGDVVEVLVQEGDTVMAGDPLIRLETEDLTRAMGQADITLQQASLRLERLQEPADEIDVEIAQAAVSDAAAAYEEAQLNLTMTEHGVSVGDSVRAARAARDETYRIYQNLVAENAGETQIARAHDAYLDALGAYNRAVEGAELQLTMARNGVTRAYHALVQAQNALDELLEGADAAEIEAARLDVAAAGLALEATEAALEEATLEAPFEGVVVAVEVEEGDSVVPGMVVVTLATLEKLQARTTDLIELDIVRVAEGQAVVVQVNALPDEAFDGVVSEIALQPGDYRGDVVYEVVIDLGDVAGAPLRWGMTALVEIEVE